MPRYIIFSDVHGTLDELLALYEKCQITYSDIIVSAGDLNDRGPNSVGVIRFFRERSRTNTVINVRGNHCWKLVRYMRHRTKDAEVANGMCAKRPELEIIANELSLEDISFLDSAVLYHRIQEYNILVVHGGILPDMRALPDPTDFKNKYFNQMMYVRYIDSNDRMRRLGTEEAGDRFWAEAYDGRFGTVIFGHQPWVEADSPKIFPHAIGLDLGCCFGNRLAAAIIDDTGIRFETVTAKQKYCEY